MEDSLPWLPRDPNPAALEPGPASFKTIDGKSTCDDAFETEPPLCKRVGDPHWSFRSSWRSLASPVIESLLLPCSCGSDGARDNAYVGAEVATSSSTVADLYISGNIHCGWQSCKRASTIASNMNAIAGVYNARDGTRVFEGSATHNYAHMAFISCMRRLVASVITFLGS